MAARESISVRNARQQFSRLLAMAGSGRAVTITRRGRAIAQITPPQSAAKPGLPDLTEFRASLGKPPKKSMATIRHLRDAERA